MRSLAVAGFVAIICLIAWLSVQIVAVVPSAFSSLASLAEGISSYEDTIAEEQVEVPVLMTSTSIEESENSSAVTITWDKDESEGSYSLAFDCVEGTTISIVRADGEREVECDTRYTLGDETKVTLVTDSTLTEDSSIPYRVYFRRSGDIEPYRTGTGNFIATAKVAEPIGTVAGETTSEDVEEPVATTPVVIPEPVIEYTYQIPSSDPNGFVDLQAKFVNVGGDVNGRFVAGRLEQNSTGAFQFEVKNIGTKTSDDWRFSISLPDGETYTSDTQRPLKPNERSILALSIVTDDDSSHLFTVTVTTDEDVRTTNNNFSERVAFSNQ